MKKIFTIFAVLCLLTFYCSVSAEEAKTISVTDTDIAEMKQLVVDAFDMASSFHTPNANNTEFSSTQTHIEMFVFNGKETELILNRRIDKYAKWSDTKTAMEAIFTGSALATFDSALPIAVKDGNVYFYHNPSQIIYEIERHDDEVNYSLDNKFIVEPIDTDSVKVIFDYAERIHSESKIFESIAIFTKTAEGWRIEESDFIDMVCEHPFLRVAPQTGISTVILAVVALVSGAYVVKKRRR